MEKEILKYKVLLIDSKINDSYILDIMDKNILCQNGFKLDILVDPSRKELEYALINNKYLCIIPLSDYSLERETDDRYQVYNYNVRNLLQNYNLKFWGSSYSTNLMLGDKAATLSLSKFQPLLKVFSRYNFDFIEHDITTLQKNLPITLIPQFHNKYISKRKHIAYSIENVIHYLKQAFDCDPILDEIVALGRTNYRDSIFITIIGNPPLSMHFVYKSMIPINTDENTSDTQYAQLISESYRLFRLYKFKDFVQFEYAYSPTDDKYYLININTTNCLNKPVCISCQEKWGLEIEKVILLMVFTFLVNQNQTDGVLSIIKDLCSILPYELVDKLLPFDVRRTIKEYDYKTVCYHLKNRFLASDESNKNDLIALIQHSLDDIPELTHKKSPFLGEQDCTYLFLDKYNDIPLHPQNQTNVLSASLQILNGQMRWHAPSMLYNINTPTMFNTISASTIINLYNPNAMTRNTSAGLLEMERQIVNQLTKLIGWPTKNSAGIFTTGGKICTAYAIKCGINRCKRATNSNKTPVVITSEINHFSIESCCAQLGLPESACIRIPVNLNGTINFEKFKTVLTNCFRKNIPIACIIFSGGNTTHSPIENLKKGREILADCRKYFSIPYTPFIYYDLVVGWPWLFFKSYDFTKNELNMNAEVLYKIKEVSNRLLYSNLADAAGIDFHKGGFSPFTNSIILVKNASELYSMLNNTKEEQHREPYHYTFNNSRKATDILSAWNVLQSVGIQGFQSYIANMMTVANTFATELSNYGFETIEKNNTYGFATLVWATSVPEKATFQEHTRMDYKTIEKNNRYLYELCEYIETVKKSL